MTEQILTQARLRELLHYDPETGKFLKNGVEPNAHSCDYLVISLMGKSHKAHRLAWFYVHGEGPAKGFIVDHVNRDRKDNRIANLRLASHRENMQNKSKPQGENSYLGVTKDRFSNKWRASIYSEGKRVGLGSAFATPEEASEAYLAAKRKLHLGFVG